MKKILLIAAALVLAGCGGEKKANAPAAEGGMAADSSAMNMSKDTTMAAPMSSDTTMARDTTKK
jgi:ABC-type glycerol-3-phosphate transport system substrate-binding protein